VNSVQKNFTCLKENAQRFALAAVGRRVDSARKPEKLEARKRLEKRADSPPSAARIVRKHALTEPTHRRDKCLGARLETPFARLHCKNTCRYYDTTAGKMPQPILTKDQRNQFDHRACQ